MSPGVTKREEALDCIRGYRALLADPARLARISDPDAVVEDVIAACKRLNSDYGPFTRKEIDFPRTRAFRATHSGRG